MLIKAWVLVATVLTGALVGVGTSASATHYGSCSGTSGYNSWWLIECSPSNDHKDAGVGKDMIDGGAGADDLGGEENNDHLKGGTAGDHLTDDAGQGDVDGICTGNGDSNYVSMRDFDGVDTSWEYEGATNTNYNQVDSGDEYWMYGAGQHYGYCPLTP